MVSGPSFLPRDFAVSLRDSRFSPSGCIAPVHHTGKGDLQMPDMMANRRNAPRYPLILKAEVTELSNRTKLNARTSDVSRTGCYIDTREPLSSGSAISLKLTQGSESIEVHGKVRYVSPGLGMGILFDEQIQPKSLAILENWLEVAAKQPA